MDPQEWDRTGERGRPKKPATISTDVGRVERHIVPLLAVDGVGATLAGIPSPRLALLPFALDRMPIVRWRFDLFNLRRVSQIHFNPG